MAHGNWRLVLDAGGATTSAVAAAGGAAALDSVAAGAKRLILENNCALLSCTPGSCYCRTTHNHYRHLGCILPQSASNDRCGQDEAHRLALEREERDEKIKQR